jgi:hypothetical protein
MSTPGQKLYDWVHANDANAEFWDDLTAVERRWWNQEAHRQLVPYTAAQRLTLLAALGLLAWAAIAGAISFIWWAVTR